MLIHITLKAGASQIHLNLDGFLRIQIEGDPVDMETRSTVGRLLEDDGAVQFQRTGTSLTWKAEKDAWGTYDLDAWVVERKAALESAADDSD